MALGKLFIHKPQRLWGRPFHGGRVQRKPAFIARLGHCGRACRRGNVHKSV